MERLYLRFPGGGIGFGLLLLRLIVATWFFETGVPMVGVSTVESIVALILLSAALSLIAGVGTSAITLGEPFAQLLRSCYGTSHTRGFLC